MTNLKATVSESKILNAFVELLQIKDFDKISISNICDKSGVSRTTFYRYYENKEDLVDSTIETIMSDLTVIFSKDPLMREGSQLEALYYFYNHGKLCQVLLKKFPEIKVASTNYLKNAYLTSDIELFKKLKEKYQVSEKYSLDIHVSAVLAPIFNWIEEGFVESPAEMVEILNKAVLWR
ncbi:MAG: TetR/AcrR family transcriptional regulator [Streptococcus sp.]|nr:TetR/AcrR family transcriptional regulator [Streptococcus sp.]